MIVSLEHVSWRRENKLVLNDVSWNIQSGEHWCLVGLNGSGKTTLLQIINGYIWPSEGKVKVFDFTYGKVKLAEVRKRIGWVSTALQQRFHGDEMTEEIVLSGVFSTIGLHEEVQDVDLHKAVGLLQSMHCEALIGREFATLSQGEQQKILIARALMASPELLILDEPCTGLDVLAREQVLAMIQMIARQPDAPTLIYVTHHIEEVLPCFTNTLLLKEGEVYASGKTEDCLTTATLSAFYEVPIEVVQQRDRKWLMLQNK
ncbi:ABC transporter ATP-binding protein [Ectobacillus polymachus]|uniref:ABC transporter ATP-binding protein n=1 Tax=Ectobacillus polymachus TaxID=1508806 RepID=UPI003A8A13B3